MIINIYVEIVQNEKTKTTKKNVTIYESKIENGRYKLKDKKKKLTYLQTKITKQRIQSI